jgi:4-hydroxy-4-methyl-2-oxoglutarate aldolase
VPAHAAKQQLSSAVFKKIQQLDTCLVSNAIERLNGRLRNEGSIWGKALQCLFPDFPPMLGYAATGRVHSSAVPVRGRCYHENMGWWRYVASIPEPGIMVLQDVDDRPGAGALVGELHASIGMAMNCVGCVTNGGVRDIPAVRAAGFHLFAGNVAVSHQYAHVAEFGVPVEIGGCTITDGDLIHADRHGVHIIPLEIAAKIPEMAEQIRHEEQNLVEFCRSARFSLHGLERKLESSPGGFSTASIG